MAMCVRGVSLVEQVAVSSIGQRVPRPQPCGSLVPKAGGRTRPRVILLHIYLPLRSNLARGSQWQNLKLLDQGSLFSARHCHRLHLAPENTIPVQILGGCCILAVDSSQVVIGSLSAGAVALVAKGTTLRPDFRRCSRL